jgi:hypothetical protein
MITKGKYLNIKQYPIWLKMQNKIRQRVVTEKWKDENKIE